MARLRPRPVASRNGGLHFGQRGDHARQFVQPLRMIEQVRHHLVQLTGLGQLEQQAPHFRFRHRVLAHQVAHPWRIEAACQQRRQQRRGQACSSALSSTLWLGRCRLRPRCWIAPSPAGFRSGGSTAVFHLRCDDALQAPQLRPASSGARAWKSASAAECVLQRLHFGGDQQRVAALQRDFPCRRARQSAAGSCDRRTSVDMRKPSGPRASRAPMSPLAM
jgi:hypothetical protein